MPKRRGWCVASPARRLGVYGLVEITTCCVLLVVGCGRSAATAPLADAGVDEGPDAGVDVLQCADACSDAATSCLDRNWAQWPMPNEAIDVDAGAPNPESYMDNGDGTVTDNVTGLVWQQAAPSVLYTQPGALSYCAGLSLGGHKDWRLPTLVELVSILEFSYDAYSEAYLLAPDASPIPPFQPFWSSTPSAGALGYAWRVGGSAATGAELTSSTINVRCVR
jgi:hypothetical protein